MRNAIRPSFLFWLYNKCWGEGTCFNIFCIMAQKKKHRKKISCKMNLPQNIQGDIQLCFIKIIPHSCSASQTFRWIKLKKRMMRPTYSFQQRKLNRFALPVQIQCCISTITECRRSKISVFTANPAISYCASADMCVNIAGRDFLRSMHSCPVTAILHRGCIYPSSIPCPKR